MFPNPQAALPLPFRPDIEQYRKQAKDLLKACKAGAPDAIRDWLSKWMDALVRSQKLQDPVLRGQLNHEFEEILSFIRREMVGSRCILANAQFVIARSHGFTSWRKLLGHIEDLASGAPVSIFESAVDAIVEGNVRLLKRLLRENPQLIHARSTREHSATLLHYVSANGVEGYRQRSPKNAVDVTTILLEAGAEVDVPAVVYRGACTTLELVATSTPPRQAGVQLGIIELLLEHGAAPDGAPGGPGMLIHCFHNGCPEAALLLANRGARLTLESAAGLGLLNAVENYFDKNGELLGSSKEDAEAAFALACGHGQVRVVEFLMQHGIEPHAGPHHETGLHWAAYGGQIAVIKLLLEREASVHIKDDTHRGTALDWALYAWSESPPGTPRDVYYEVVTLLIAAGSTVDRGWIDQRSRLAAQIRSDVRMKAALGVEL